MNSPDERSFEARLPCLGDVVAFVESACAGHSIDRQAALRLAFVAEELFTNTVLHGHGGDCASAVTLALTFPAGAIVLDYADSAPPYNPLEHCHSGPPAHAPDVTLRPVGGLGVYAIGQLVEAGSYRRQDGRNLLHLRLPRGA